jgi:hypothetical protein
LAEIRVPLTIDSKPEAPEISQTKVDEGSDSQFPCKPGNLAYKPPAKDKRNDLVLAEIHETPAGNLSRELDG